MAQKLYKVRVDTYFLVQAGSADDAKARVRSASANEHTAAICTGLDTPMENFVTELPKVLEVGT